MVTGTREKLNQTPCPPPRRRDLDLHFLYFPVVIQMLKWKIYGLVLHLSTAPSPVIASKAKQGEGVEG